MKQVLVDNWKNAWKWLSIQLAALLVIMDVLAQNLPAVAAYLPEGWVKWLGIAIIVARVINQTSQAPKPSGGE